MVVEVVLLAVVMEVVEAARVMEEKVEAMVVVLVVAVAMVATSMEAVVVAAAATVAGAAGGTGEVAAMVVMDMEAVVVAVAATVAGAAVGMGEVAVVGMEEVAAVAMGVVVGVAMEEAAGTVEVTVEVAAAGATDTYRCPSSQRPPQAMEHPQPLPFQASALRHHLPQDMAPLQPPRASQALVRCGPQPPVIALLLVQRLESAATAQPEVLLVSGRLPPPATGPLQAVDLDLPPAQGTAPQPTPASACPNPRPVHTVTQGRVRQGQETIVTVLKSMPRSLQPWQWVTF